MIQAHTTGKLKFRSWLEHFLACDLAQIMWTLYASQVRCVKKTLPLVEMTSESRMPARSGKGIENVIFLSFLQHPLGTSPSPQGPYHIDRPKMLHFKQQFQLALGRWQGRLSSTYLNDDSLMMLNFRNPGSRQQKSLSFIVDACPCPVLFSTAHSFCQLKGTGAT